jgi:hypothetical protein
LPFGIIAYLQYDGWKSRKIGSLVEDDFRRRIKNIQTQGPEEDVLRIYDRDVLPPSFYKNAIEEVKAMKPVGFLSLLTKHLDLKALNLWLKKSKKYNPQFPEDS